MNKILTDEKQYCMAYHCAHGPEFAAYLKDKTKIFEEELVSLILVYHQTNLELLKDKNLLSLSKEELQERFSAWVSKNAFWDFHIPLDEMAVAFVDAERPFMIRCDSGIEWITYKDVIDWVEAKE